jgi:hypothetical protein
VAIFGRFLDAEITVDSVDLSSFARSVTINSTNEKLDATTFGNTSRVTVAGQNEWTVSIEFFMSYYTAEVHQTLWPIHSNGTTVALTVMPNKTAGVSTENPKFTGNVTLNEYTPIDGEHGAVLSSTVSFDSAGDLTAATS